MKLTDDTKFAIASLVEAALKKRFSDWKQRGNREDYIASDCWKDADLDSISTGILSILPYKGLDSLGFHVKWGAMACFEFGDPEGLTDHEMNAYKDICSELVGGAGLIGSFDGVGSFDGDDDGIYYNADFSFEINPSRAFKAAALKCSCVEGLSSKLINAYADRIFRAFERDKEQLEEKVFELRKMLNAEYAQAEASCKSKSKKKGP